MRGSIVPGTYVLIEVTDNGEGIAPEIIERIFEPFYTTKAVGLGSGLGLSSALGIVKSHDGYIHVVSKVGKGTTFKVYLPAVPGAVPAPPREEAAAPRGHGELVLLVDDEAPILEITSKALRAFGYKVVTADDATRAIGVFATHMAEVAVVITDIMMPGMDGYTLITTLRRMRPTVRIIASSGQNAPNNKQKAHEVGAIGFLPKPYSAEDMLRTIAEALGPAALR
jgi:CheY-like chemotaxis protein